MCIWDHVRLVTGSASGMGRECIGHLIIALNKALDESPPLIGASKAQHGHSSRQRHTNRTDRACQETVSQESTED